MKKFKLSDINIGKFDFLTFGFFRLRLLIYCIFSGFMWWEQKSYATALFAWFIWIQIELLFFSIDLDDTYVSNWEAKLGKKIKNKNGKKIRLPQKPPREARWHEKT